MYPDEAAATQIDQYPDRRGFGGSTPNNCTIRPSWLARCCAFGPACLGILFSVLKLDTAPRRLFGHNGSLDIVLVIALCRRVGPRETH